MVEKPIEISENTKVKIKDDLVYIGILDWKGETYETTIISKSDVLAIAKVIKEES